MLAFIKTNYQVGDPIEVTCSEGVITGTIEYVSSKYIVLRQPNGKICGIAASDIRTFTASSPVVMVPAGGGQATKAPVSEEAEIETETEAEETAQDEEILVEEPVQEADKPQSIRDVLGDTDKVQSADELTGAPNIVAEPKVIGHIDLASVDSRYGKRKYFRTDNNDEGETSYSNSYSENTNHNTYGGYQRQPYVSAKGRITYYNPTKRFGFIHDFATEADLYFYIQQVADNELYTHLAKGTKVVYTIGKNNQGPTAECIHLAHTVNDLIEMAEDLYESRHPHFARGVLKHVLEVYPDNKDAADLMDEINANVPQPTAQTYEASQYNPCKVYAEAKKAYLEKDYAKAEEGYLKAIEAGEKPESCVKDLITLYVSCFKQAETEAEREEARRKAADLLEKHRSLLADNLTTQQFLALNYYLPIQDYDMFLTTVDEILANPQVDRVTSRKVFYIWQKGIAYNKLGKTEEALALVEQGLAIAPFNRQLQNLREIILHPELLEATTSHEEGTSEETSTEEV